MLDSATNSATGYKSIYDFGDANVESFSVNGFVVVRDAFPAHGLETLQREICEFARNFFKIEASPFGKHDYPSEIERMFDIAATKCTKDFQDFLGKVGQLYSYLQLHSNSAITEAIAGIGGNTVFTVKGGLFFNSHNLKQLTYDWHQETPYFLENELAHTLWFPVIRDLKFTGGEMLIVSGSHLHGVRPYTETRRSRGYLQKTVVLNESDSKNVLACDLNLGDAVLFHPDIIHCTSPSLRSICRVNAITRFVTTK
jgi:ectoine hydroxylase-related dioxygenase (phytanoyl-CoA dioxygenase family)